MTLVPFIGLFLSTALAIPASSRIQEVLQEEAGWSYDGLKEGVSVYTKDVPGSELSAWKGVRVVQVDLDVLWSLICDVGNHDQVSDMLHETVVLARQGDRVDYYQVSRSPRFVPISERYWVNFAVIAEDIGGVKGHHTRTWDSLEDTTPYTQVIEGILTRYPDAIRLAATHGSWELRPRPGGEVEIIYRTFSDPGGSVPGGVMDYLSGRSLPNNILQFEEAARARSQ